MEKLENKIREALPRLKELTPGCFIAENISGNIFKLLSYNKTSETFDYYNPVDGMFEEALETLDCFEVIGHPIQLNDVLEYWKKKSNTTSATAFKNELYKITMDWNLSSVFLADQSDELKEFLNDL